MRIISFLQASNMLGIESVQWRCSIPKVFRSYLPPLYIWCNTKIGKSNEVSFLYENFHHRLNFSRNMYRPHAARGGNSATQPHTLSWRLPSDPSTLCEMRELFSMTLPTKDTQQIEGIFCTVESQAESLLSEREAVLVHHSRLFR